MRNLEDVWQVTIVAKEAGPNWGVKDVKAWGGPQDGLRVRITGSENSDAKKDFLLFVAVPNCEHWHLRTQHDVYTMGSKGSSTR